MGPEDDVVRWVWEGQPANFFGGSYALAQRESACRREVHVIPPKRPKMKLLRKTYTHPTMWQPSGCADRGHDWHDTPTPDTFLCIKCRLEVHEVWGPDDECPDCRSMGELCFVHWEAQNPLTCMWCAAEYHTMGELEAHEEECMGA